MTVKGQFGGPPQNGEAVSSELIAGYHSSDVVRSSSRDAFGSHAELRPIIKELKAPADLYVVEGGDHSFKVLKRAGGTQEDAYKAVLDRIELWLRQSFAN